jgi:AsmA protein
MSSPVKRILLKTLKISGIVIGSLLLLMFILPFLFPQTITNKIKEWANGNINGHVAFSSTSLSFFKHFPSLTLTLYDVDLNGSAPFEKDTLVSSKEISLGIDLSSVFSSKVTIDKIYLDNALINIQVDSAGHANYNIYKGSKQNADTKADTSSASLGIDQILVQNSHLIYNDRSIPTKIEARGFNYTGSGDLSKDVFDLHTHTDIKSIDFYYGDQPYIINKKVNADLVTKINTKSLAFIFQKNDLMINDLPVQFIGKFAFITDGYDMDFKIDSHESDLSDIFSALPAEYQKMVANTDVDGTGNLQIELSGKYIAKTNTKPDLSMHFKVRDGYIADNKTPSPVRNLFLNFDADLPGLNPDSLTVNIDSLHFNIDKDNFNAALRIKGLKTPYIYTRVNTEIDLQKWNRAFGIKTIDLKGRYALHLLVDGKYAKGIVHTGTIRKKTDTVITSIPKFTLRSSFTNGYIKYAKLPQSVNNITFNINATCPDNNVKHISLSVDNLSATALSNYVKGYFRLGNTDDFPVDAAMKIKFHLSDIKQFYPIDSTELEGDLDADITTKGKYLPAKKMFPVTVANISMANGSIKTKYYPHPIENIQVSTSIVNRTGTLAGTQVNIKPISFQFEGQPFTLQANLHNFNNLQYNIKSHGVINIGKIYQVFAIKGYNVNGMVTANVSFRGKQSDAVAGRYDQLFNSGTLKVKDISLTSELFPKPFVIRNGVFSFNQDKMNFDAFTAQYGNSTIVLNGALSNVIDYATKPSTSTLKGDFNFTSNMVNADDFMAYSGTPQAGSNASGVIIIPKNLNLNFTADVKQVKYNGLTISNAKGQMTINNGNLSLKNTGFNIIGTPVTMDADYTSSGPKSAFFNYHIKATDFDIHKAYTDIKIFHDIVTTAAYTKGLVSLDYQLSGRLNSNMMPVYPSLKGGGTLSAKALKVHGFKLMGSIGKSAGKDSVTNKSDLADVAIKTTIANNIITIPRTKMRIAGFRARFEGQVNFDRQMNIQFRLGLPPFGIIGIPMTITGTQDKPVIKMGHGKKEDELKETEDAGN